MLAHERRDARDRTTPRRLSCRRRSRACSRSGSSGCRSYSDVIDVAAVLGREFELEPLAALVPLDGAHRPARRAGRDPAGRRRARRASSSPTRCCRTRPTRGCCAGAGRRCTRGSPSCSTGVDGSPSASPRSSPTTGARAGEPAQVRPVLAGGRRAGDRPGRVPRGRRPLPARASMRSTRPARTRATARSCSSISAASLQAGVGYAAPGVDDAYAEARRARRRRRLASSSAASGRSTCCAPQYGQALEFADELLTLARADRRSRAAGRRPLCARGMVHMYRGEFELARAAPDRGLRRATRGPRLQLDQRGGRATSASRRSPTCSSVLWNLGEVGGVAGTQRRSLELAERVGGPVTRAQAWGMRALLHLARVEPTEFARWTERTHAHSVDHNVGYWRALSSLLAGALQARGGRARGRPRARRRGPRGLSALRARGSGSRASTSCGPSCGCWPATTPARSRRSRRPRRTSRRPASATAEAELYRFKGRLLMDDAIPTARPPRSSAPSPSRARSARSCSSCARRRRSPQHSGRSGRCTRSSAWRS